MAFITEAISPHKLKMASRDHSPAYSGTLSSPLPILAFCKEILASAAWGSPWITLKKSLQCAAYSLRL